MPTMRPGGPPAPSPVQPAARPTGGVYPPRPQGLGAGAPANRAPARPMRLPQGYRWIAVRPGAPPPAPRRHRALGPTPRYKYIPRWGLVDPVEPAGAAQTDVAEGRVPARVLEGLLKATIISLAIAAGAHLLRYLLMAYNRGALIPHLVASGSNVLVLLSTAAAFAIALTTAVFLTEWLIARRASAYQSSGYDDPRALWEIRALALVPIANILGSWLLLLELAKAESRWYRQYRVIRTWTVLYLVTTVLAVVTWICRDPATPQGIADNALLTAFAYGIAAYAAWALQRVYRGFTTVEGELRPTRWLAVEYPSEPARGKAADTRPHSAHQSDSDASVEDTGAEPAALDRDRVVGAR